MIAIITGGAGFIGSNYLHQAIEEEWYDQIFVYDYFGTGSNINNIPTNKNIKLYRTDIKNIDEKLIKRADILINFAAETHVDRSISSSIVFTKSNVLSFHYMLEKVRKFNDNLRIVQISTDEVYGPIQTGSFSEESRLFPRNPYSATKASAENLVNAYLETYGMNIVIVRPSNNYGPRQFHEKLIPKTITNFLNNKPIGIYGDGSQIRDWTFVVDNCNAIHLISEKGGSGEIYNVSSKNEYTNKEVIDKIAKIMDIHFEYIKFIPDRLGHDFRYSIDNSKILKLGWKPSYTFDEGLMKTIMWYVNNNDYFSA